MIKPKQRKLSIVKVSEQGRSRAGFESGQSDSPTFTFKSSNILCYPASEIQ